jgi:translation elongation factor EF-G
MEMYEAALKNEIKVYETDIEEYNHLKDCKTPYNRIPLCELESIGYIYIDVDGDSINELVIDCGDTLILRYYEGTVYVYPFTFRNMYQLNTDGSYNWNHTGQDFEYGENQLAFDGAELKPKEIWRIVNDGEPNAEYYIEGKQVSQEELQKYTGDNQKTKIEFSPLAVSWQKTISLEKVLEIASEYWYECYNIKAGDVDRETGFPYAFLPKNSNNENYSIALAWLVEGTHYSTLEMIEIDAFTGEIIVPTYEPDGKG